MTGRWRPWRWPQMLHKAQEYYSTPHYKDTVHPFSILWIVCAVERARTFCCQALPVVSGSLATCSSTSSSWPRGFGFSIRREGGSEGATKKIVLAFMFVSPRRCVHIQVHCWSLVLVNILYNVLYTCTHFLQIIEGDGLLDWVEHRVGLQESPHALGDSLRAGYIMHI